MTRAVVRSGPEWQAYARDYLRRYCVEHGEVFCDDVWESGLERPESPRAFGAVMQHALRAGWMVGTDRARRSHQSNNSPRTVYRSQIATDGDT